MCFLRHKTYTWVVAQWANKLFLTGSISSSGKQPSQTIWALPKIYSCHFAKLAWKGRRKNFGRRNLQTLKVKVQRVQISRLTQQGQKLRPASDQPTAETTYFDKKNVNVTSKDQLVLFYMEAIKRDVYSKRGSKVVFKCRAGTGLGKDSKLGLHYTSPALIFLKAWYTKLSHQYN